MKPIPLLIPDIPTADEILPFLREIDAARHYTNFGSLVQRLEQLIARELGRPAPAVTTVANCTLGLELSLTALRLKPGGTVLVPALTFVATASAVSRAGLVTALADIDEHSWLLTPQIAREAKASADLACIIPVAAFGCPHSAESWDDFTRETGIPVLIDAAGAFGNQAIGRTTAVAYSFHATKALGIGEGGLVAARDAEFIARVRQLSNFGIDVSTGLALQEGTNAKLSEFHAAVGLAALMTWGARCEARSRLHRDYTETRRLPVPGSPLPLRLGPYPSAQRPYSRKWAPLGAVQFRAPDGRAQGPFQAYRSDSAILLRQSAPRNVTD